jgi:tRNA pseudouridine38-40 synthase
MRYAACIEYHGASFSGWQAQKFSVRTVQEELESALSKVADHNVSVVTAGRTDTGVHASHQIVHFDSDSTRKHDAWVLGANRFLPRDVRVTWVTDVPDSFHARFAAVSRSYRYIIYNRRVSSATLENLTTFEARRLDIDAIKVAASSLLGRHDFSSFRAAGCQASSPVRTVSNVQIGNKGEFIWLDISANAFLQHMVRNIAGALIEVGYGKRADNWIDELLTVCDRTKGSITAEPNGLYLCGVDYPPEFQLPSKYKTVSYWG